MKKHKLYTGDSIEIMKSLKPDFVDIIVTSPPYNVGTNYSVYNDDLPEHDYLAWTERWIMAARRVMKDSGSLFFVIGSTPAKADLQFKVAERVSSVMELQNAIIWVKSIAIDSIQYGHYQPINSARFLSNNFELILHLTKEKTINLNKTTIGVPYVDESNLKRWKTDGSNLHDRGNVWFIPYKTRRVKNTHPCEFPVELPEMCIKLHGYNEETIVMDPFMGTGATGIASQKLGCRFIGIDIDENYVRIANKRISEVAGS